MKARVLLPWIRAHPLIPEQGSVGASGDLAPLAHLTFAGSNRQPVLFHRSGDEVARKSLSAFLQRPN